MKYEISQEEYTEFLNKITAAGDGFRFPGKNGLNRHAITGSVGSRTTSNPNLPCNYLSWYDMASYLDWAALRPMTELEFEKAARGTAAPVADEHVWGTTTIATTEYTVGNHVRLSGHGEREQGGRGCCCN